MPIIAFAEPYENGATRGHSQSTTMDGHPVTHFYFTKKTHVGLCLKEWEVNGRDDSDFYMLVWNDETGKPEERMFASTRGWTYPCMASSVDATPEVRAKYDAWRAARAEENRKAAEAAELRRPRKGKTVRITQAVTRGANLCKAGEVGTVFWEGQDAGARSRYVTPMQESIMRGIDPLRYVRLGVDIEGRRIFINAKKVEVV